MDDLRKAFIQMDLNGDGKIEPKEFKVALGNIGANYSEEEITQLLKSLDTNKNGFIDYTEFLAGCMKSKIYLNNDYLKRAFEFFD